MSNDAQIDAKRRLILEAQEQGGLAKLWAYIRLSGPGWLQSAITLGGGSLSSSLYLGIIAGVSMIWVQPFAMILGVIMLSAISYVTLTTGERPFRAINKHINPVLGWSWLIASLMATMVWAMPQYSLCFGVLEQNLLPSLFSEGGPLAGNLGKWVVSAVILCICLPVTWSYGSGSVAVKIYETTLKIVVAMIVLCFFGVVVRMSMAGDGIDWGAVGSGLIPKWRNLFEPSNVLQPLVDAIADPGARQYWSNLIVSQQRDIVIAAGATAVGINMTFLLPYNLLSSGWNRDFRGLSIFDMFTGMFFPFVAATGCVVIAAATQFHGHLPEGSIVEGSVVQVPERFEQQYAGLISARNAAQTEGKYEMAAEPTAEESQLAAMLVQRDTGDLAKSLQQLFAGEQGDGRFFSNIVFGLGVVGMTLSTISVMLLISGFVFCEIFDAPPGSWVFRLGCLAAASGALWPVIWTGQARAYLAIPTSVFCMMLLPVAYMTFFLMMNQKAILGEDRPKGMKRVVWNIAMGFAVIAATAAAYSAVVSKGGTKGLLFAAGYIVLVLVVQVLRKPSSETTA